MYHYFVPGGVLGLAAQPDGTGTVTVRVSRDAVIVRKADKDLTIRRVQKVKTENDTFQFCSRLVRRVRTFHFRTTLFYRVSPKPQMLLAVSSRKFSGNFVSNGAGKVIPFFDQDSFIRLTRVELRLLVDACYQEFMEQPNSVPSTDWADSIIDRVLKPKEVK